MILTVRDLLLLLVLGVLLSLSYLTIKYAKASGTNFRSYGAYLFEARGRRQSLASNVGAVFSVTYFFGATFIYGMVFGAWIRIMTVLVFVAVTALAIYVTSQIDTANVRTADSNLLLAFFAKKLEPNDFRTVIRIFTIIYFALLVEELAVSRLVLHALTRQPIAVAFLLITICFVIYTYLYLGGFRAVVTADSVQIVVLILFLLMLVILMREYTTPSELLWRHLNSQSPMATLNLVGAGVFGISWFMPAVDFYSRLNFAGRARGSETTAFIMTSFAITGAVMLIGALFGDCLASHLAVTTPSDYVFKAIRFFVDQSPLVALVFIGGLFSMIFTTIDTLLLLNLQVGYYQQRRWFRRENLLNILLAAIVISTGMSFDATSAVGIFIGSCMVFPTLALARLLWPKVFGILPVTPTYLVAAMALSTLIFVIYFQWIENRFDRHFLLAIVTLCSAVACGVSANTWKAATRAIARRRNDKTVEKE
jgi:hypothetical protein